MPAAEDWLSLKVASPMPRRSYLVCSQSVGDVMDVAFFEGIRPNQKGYWWVMTDVEFAPDSITHFAPINPISD